MPDFDVPQVVESAAKAAYEASQRFNRGSVRAEEWELLPEYWRRIFRAQATAALAVIVPAVTEQVRALHKRVHLVFTWNSGLHAEDPCPECDGKAGEWPCGCWGDYDIEYHCLVLLRFAAVADCDQCDAAGYLRGDAMHPRADHHPMKGVCRMLDVPDDIDCSVMVDLPDAEFERGDYDGDLFSDFGGGVA